jgi:hypothetical protein
MFWKVSGIRELRRSLQEQIRAEVEEFKLRGRIVGWHATLISAAAAAWPAIAPDCECGLAAIKDVVMVGISVP